MDKIQNTQPKIHKQIVRVRGWGTPKKNLLNDNGTLAFKKGRPYEIECGALPYYLKIKKNESGEGQYLLGDTDPQAWLWQFTFSKNKPVKKI